MATNHNPFQLICIFLNLGALLVVTLVVVSALSFEYDFHAPLPGLLQDGVTHVDKTFPTPISMDTWLHACWLVVIAWQIAWSIYGVTGICRTFAGIPVYASPELQNVPLLLFSILSCCMAVAWFIVYDREYVTTSVLCSFCVTGLAWIAYIFSLHNLHTGIYRLMKGERFKDIWLHRFLVQNGLALFGAWTYLVTVFNLATTLVYNDRLKMDDDLASVISLSILGGQMFLFLLLDVIVLDAWTRYTFTPYVVNIVVLCACMLRSEPWESDDVVFILLAAILTFSLLSIMIKSACVAYRTMKSSSSGGGEITGEANMPIHMGEANYLLK